MLIARTNIKGIDKKIDKLQSFMHDRLLAAWGIDTSLYKCYPRCYRNQSDDGYIPETHLGGKDYNDVFLDDRLAALSFFGNSNVMYNVNGSAGKTSVHLIFFVDLSRIRSGTERRDEEARLDVYKILNYRMYAFQPTAVITGIDSVFSEYPGTKTREWIKYRDMHPHHCFRFNLDLIYDPALCY
jgi:hypothetical protein